MSDHNENLSAQQSLDIITNMIKQAQGKVSGYSFYFILWGWTIVLADLGMYSLMRFSNYQYPYIVWLLTIPAWAITIIYAYRHDQRTAVQSHLDRISMWLWMGMGIGIIPVVAFGSVVGWNICPIILLMAAVPTFVSGIIVRFKPLMFGGVSFWIGGAICFLAPQQEQYLVSAITISLGYLVPGYLLRNLKSK
jgi:hypothetical protein